MNIKQIKNFIRKANYGKDIYFVIVNIFDGYPLYIYQKWAKDKLVNIRKIYITRRVIKRNIYLKTALLHEIGHLTNKAYKTRHINEYHAQMWAINRAKAMGLAKVAKELKNQIITKWPKLAIPYRKASKIFKESNK